MMKITLLALLALSITFTASAYQVRYPGKHHTYSHGGNYVGGHGSSHKGGHYRLARTHNHYGRHK